MQRYETLTALSAAARARFDVIIDARSPSEFAEDHVPGAINLPVLSDAERAEIGTLYAQVSPFEAKRKGAALVAKNVATHLQTHLADAPRGLKPLVYCWRGGMRSNSFATILAAVGWRTAVIEGGYRSWRRAVVAGLAARANGLKLIMLDGQTGAGKTVILHHLAQRGAQIIDLEDLAKHRGSAFGAAPDTEQPSQKAFETALWAEIEALDLDQPVFVEAESARIGQRRIPEPLWKAMRTAPQIVVKVPAQARAAHILERYPDMVADQCRIDAALDQLVRLHGAETVSHWRALAQAGDYFSFAERLITAHYDPAYNRARKRQAASPLAIVTADTLDEAGFQALCDQVLAAAQGLTR